MELTRKHITWGSIVASAAGFSTLIATWDDIGLPWPLTRQSETIQEMQGFDDIQSIEISILKKKRLIDDIATTKLYLSQFETRGALTPFETRLKIDYETALEKYRLELAEMVRKGK